MDNEAWANLLYTWAPILLMIGFWVFIMCKLGTLRHPRYTERSLEIMEQQQKLLERIATALERRNGRE